MSSWLVFSLIVSEIKLDGFRSMGFVKSVSCLINILFGYNLQSRLLLNKWNFKKITLSVPWKTPSVIAIQKFLTWSVILWIICKYWKLLNNLLFIAMFLGVVTFIFAKGPCLGELTLLVFLLSWVIAAPALFPIMLNRAGNIVFWQNRASFWSRWGDPLELGFKRDF
jgi:hypothetical protein